MPQLGALAAPLVIAGTATQVVGGIQSMNTADATAKYNEEVLQRQAAAARTAASYDASRIARKGAEVVATEKSLQAASGIDPGSGSAKDVRSYSAEKNLQDQLARIYTGQVQSDADIQQSNVLDAMRGPNRTGAVLGIGGTILGGATKAAMMSRPGGMYSGMYG